MQLKKPVRGALALATCALVNGVAHAEEGDWKASGSFLYYGEKGRVTALEPAIYATEDIGDEQTLGVRLVYDSLTGASPSGASVSSSAQTIGTTTTEAGKLPVEKFSDTRTAVGIDWGAQTSRVSNRTIAFNFSKENDYSSVGGSGTWTRDYNKKLTTLAFALGGSYDTIQPHGTIPGGLQTVAVQSATMNQTMTGVSGATTGGGTTTTGGGGTTTTSGGTGGGMTGGTGGCTNCRYKTLGDAMIGITQVLSRRTLMQMNYSINSQSGYLTDPYKIVSLVDATGATTGYVFEKRPTSRLANSLFIKFAHDFDEDVAHLSYRYFADNWGIRAQTAELQYRFRVTDWLYFEPQFRYHQQTKAKFYHHSLLDTSVSTVDYASADSRLADMISRSAGLKIGVPMSGGTELSARYVKMVEKGKSHPADAIGSQTTVDLYPKMEASIATISFSMPF